MSERYAVYFSPDDSTALARFGVRVLGRTNDGREVDASADDYHDPDVVKALTATPSHYGFHATLKAPFQLAPGTTRQALLDAVAKLASEHSSVEMRGLKPQQISGFLALMLTNQPDAVKLLANHCVERLEDFRAPLTSVDIERRNPGALSHQQRQYLHQFGYPFVMSEFRFHMTLTGRCKNIGEYSDYIDWLNSLYERMVTSPPDLDRLCVFWQPDRETAFTRIAEFTLEA
jgi:hypothetical protein